MVCQVAGVLLVVDQKIVVNSENNIPVKQFSNLGVSWEAAEKLVKELGVFGDIMLENPFVEWLDEDTLATIYRATAQKTFSKTVSVDKLNDRHKDFYYNMLGHFDLQ